MKITDEEWELHEKYGHDKYYIHGGEAFSYDGEEEEVEMFDNYDERNGGVK